MLGFPTTDFGPQQPLHFYCREVNWCSSVQNKNMQGVQDCLTVEKH